MIKSLLFKRPLLVVFDVTKRCNSKCSMCSIWKHPSKVSDELSLDEIKKIFTDLKSFGIRQVFLQGGEPLLRKDIFEIINLMISLGLKPSLITNGLLLNKERIDKLAKLKCNVSISLDSLISDRYRKIRGVDGLSVVLKAINYASKIKRKSNWFINSTISELNSDELIKLYNFSLSKGFIFSVYPYNYSLCNASAKNDSLVFKNVKKVIKSFNALIVLARKNKDVINELIYKEIITYLSGNYSKPCDALKYSLMLNEKGALGPCIELSSEFSLKKKRISEVFPLLNKKRVEACYKSTPCFYGCTRASGILFNNWINLLVFSLIHPNKVRVLIKSL